MNMQKPDAKTVIATAYPRLYWFSGIFLVVIALSLRGAGMHEVQVVEP